MKRFTAALAALVACVAFTGCTSSTDGRTGVRVEACAFGHCIVPQAMTAGAQAVPETAVVAGPVVAPATVVSQPALAAVATPTPVVQAYAPPPVSYNVPQTEK